MPIILYNAGGFKSIAPIVWFTDAAKRKLIKPVMGNLLGWAAMKKDPLGAGKQAQENAAAEKAAEKAAAEKAAAEKGSQMQE